MRLKVCRSCGRGMPKDCTQCRHCGTDTLSVFIKKKAFNVTMLTLITCIVSFTAYKAVEIKEYIVNPPITHFDLSYDANRFSDLKNLDSYGDNNWLYRFSNKTSESGYKGVSAQTISTNIVKLKSYGSSKMELNLVRNKSNEFEVLFQLMGQFDCDISKKNCKLTANFDKSGPEKFDFKKAPNGRDDLIYIVNKEDFIKKLKSSKTVSIGVNVYNSGSATYYFNVKNLILNFNDSWAK